MFPQVLSAACAQLEVQGSSGQLSPLQHSVRGLRQPQRPGLATPGLRTAFTYGLRAARRAAGAAVVQRRLEGAALGPPQHRAVSVSAFDEPRATCSNRPGVLSWPRHEGKAAAAPGGGSDILLAGAERLSFARVSTDMRHGGGMLYSPQLVGQFFETFGVSAGGSAELLAACRHCLDATVYLTGCADFFGQPGVSPASQKAQVCAAAPHLMEMFKAATQEGGICTVYETLLEQHLEAGLTGYAWDGLALVFQSDGTDIRGVGLVNFAEHPAAGACRGLSRGLITAEAIGAAYRMELLTGAPLPDLGAFAGLVVIGDGPGFLRRCFAAVRAEEDGTGPRASDVQHDVVRRVREAAAAGRATMAAHWRAARAELDGGPAASEEAWADVLGQVAGAAAGRATMAARWQAVRAQRAGSPDASEEACATVQGQAAGLEAGRATRSAAVSQEVRDKCKRRKAAQRWRDRKQRTSPQELEQRREYGRRWWSELQSATREREQAQQQEALQLQGTRMRKPTTRFQADM